MIASQTSNFSIPDRVNILGVGIHPVNMHTVIPIIFDSLKNKHKGYVCVTGVHGVIEAQSNLAFKRILNRSFLTVPDGMPIVWTGKIMGFKNIGRVYGPDLMREICDKGRAFGIRHFLYGGRPGVAQLLQKRLEELYPGINIVGTFTPPFRPLNPAEKAELFRTLECTKPDILWVGISTPKQELFMHEYLEELPTILMFGVGAAFDIITGLVPQAPCWVQRCGLEWFFRLCTEPRRLFKRYAKIVPLYPILLTLQFMGLKKFPLIK